MSSRSNERHGCTLPIAIALIGALATITAALLSNDRLLERLFPSSIPAASASQPPRDAPKTQAGSSITASTAPVSEVSPASIAGASGDCVITISNSLVALMSEPDTFSQQIIRVSPGEYPTLDYTETTFVSETQGWFRIEAEGRSGWVRNDTWTISGKTAGCP